MQLDITYRDLDSSAAVDAAVKRWADRLEHVYERIGCCHVLIEQPHRHQRQQDERFHVALRLDVPGGEITVTQKAHHDVYVALGDAFRAARRQLQDFLATHRASGKRHPLRRLASALRTARA